MKFAKELEQELVPEWRIKYLNYKAGKKYVKAVSRAINRANQTPILRRRSGDFLPPRQTPNLFTPGSPFAQKQRSRGGAAGASAGAGDDEQASLRASPARIGRTKANTPKQPQHTPGSTRGKHSAAAAAAADERQRLTSSPPHDRPRHYGSISPGPRMRSPSVATANSAARDFELPAPALRVPSNTAAATESLTKSRPMAKVLTGGSDDRPVVSTGGVLKSATPWARPPARRSASMAVPYRAPSGSASGGGGSGGADYFASSSGGAQTFPTPYELTPRQRFRRMFSMASPGPWRNQTQAPAGEGKDDISMRAFDEVREREKEFFQFLDGELDKVETFYKQKEEQAGQRLALLREQLHEMRNRRIDEIQQAKRRGEEAGRHVTNGGNDNVSPGQSGDENGQQSDADQDGNTKGWDVHNHLVGPLRAKLFKPGPNSKALQKMPQTPRILGGHGGGIASRFGAAAGVLGADPAHRDYTRRPGDHDIPYRTAKRKLKLALQEFYRGLELLKSYALLNRTAFRKLNKKYDKAVNARPPYRYMNEKVNRSWFVNSTVVDDLIVAAEDLYARYFERGNHKIAAGKLRALTKRPGDESGSAFRNGIMLGVGAVFAIQGAVDGAHMLLHDPDPNIRLQTSYLLQIYGGYFLMLYLFAFFCIDCWAWARNKINYPFIFEFDPRSHLDWRQLSQFPSFFLLVFGLFLWLNFSDASNPELFLYYPVMLLGLTFALLFFPAPTLWHRSRKWFLYSHWRLFFAGLYPVEFRDFFLGDIYCSLVYSTCNIELFFCIYAHNWINPAQCNSNHSRLLGFFTTLPPIWRAFQCLRRYRDTKNVFPHLVNCGKYAATIMSYVCLSLYRIDQSNSNLALFVTFSVINSIYTSIWDLFMDFSLLQFGSRHFLLRDILALKRHWLYYAIMIIDPILRFSWIFYAIFTHDAQHSTICSFLVSFAEASRRGMWTLFRVENEHCANVAQYKASRDVPLPYHLHEIETPRPSQEFMGPLSVSQHEDDHGRWPPVDGAATAATVGTPATMPASGRVPTATGASSTRTSNQQHPAAAGTPASAAGTWSETGAAAEAAATAAATAAEEGVAGKATGVTESPGLGTLRRRLTSTLAGTGKKTIGMIMAEAHKQDFEKKRKPGQGADGSPHGGGASSESSPMLLGGHQAPADDSEDEEYENEYDDNDGADHDEHDMIDEEEEEEHEVAKLDDDAAREAEAYGLPEEDEEEEEDQNDGKD